MKNLLTEQEARQLLKKDGSIRSLNVPKDTIVTPSAREFLKMTGITLCYTGGNEKTPDEKTPDVKTADGKTVDIKKAEGGAGIPIVYIGPDGEKLDHKPEELTHLYGNRLTEKDNPVIVFRGKLDVLCAMILEAQALGGEKENRAFVSDLQEILEFVRSLLPAEYKGTPFGEFHLLGLSSRDLRERSHHPEKYFGRKHLLMHHSMGALSLRLNLLRTATREVELAAVTAFRSSRDCDPSDNNPSNSNPPDSNSMDSGDPQAPAKSNRDEIIIALNRLSSLFYILIYKYLPENYYPAGNAGI